VMLFGRKVHRQGWKTQRLSTDFCCGNLLLVFVTTHVYSPCLHYAYIYIKVKVKLSRYRLGVAQRVGRGIALLFHDRGTSRGEWSAERPSRTLPLGKTRYPLYRRLRGPQGRSGRAENLVSTGIRSRTVHPVAQSLYRLSYRATHTYIHIYI